jgi:hypothetical protein
MSEPFIEHQTEQSNYYVDRLIKAQLANQQLKWPIKRGDLILPTQPEVTETSFAFTFQDTSPETRKFPLIVYEYSEDDDMLPTIFAKASDGTFAFIGVEHS